MEDVSIISIGNELLAGKTMNTNAPFLAKNLTNLGFIVKKILTIPDDSKIVSEEISHAIGTENNDSPVGSNAAFTIISFAPSMIITTGNGGMVLTGLSIFMQQTAGK